jgi:predicted ArsR family transcriptional regulator
MSTAERILYLITTRGAQTAQALADELELTSMGVRKQLLALQEKGLLDS